MDQCLLRKAGLAARRALSPVDREIKNAAICHGLIAAEPFRRAKTVLAYAAFDGEADIESAMQEALRLGKTVCFPSCTSDTEMIALMPKTPDAMQIGRYGILSPDSAASRTIEPEEIDLVLVPCAAFDFAGHRIGMGAGYYDRFLPRCVHAVRVLVAYECQHTEAIRPNRTDAPVDWIITEQRCVKF